VGIFHDNWQKVTIISRKWKVCFSVPISSENVPISAAWLCFAQTATKMVLPGGEDLENRTAQRIVCIKDALVVYFVYLLFPSAALALFTFCFGPPDRLMELWGDAITVVGFVFAILLLTKMAHKQDVSVRKAIRLEWGRGVISRKEIGILFLTGILMNLFFSAALSFLPQWMLGTYTESTQNVLGQDNSLLSILSLALAAPITEEIIFRGFLLRGLEREFPAKTAVLAVSLLFGVTHIYPVWVAYAMVCGLALCWFAEKWNNLLASIIVHVAFNTASLPQLLIPQDSKLYQILYLNKMIIFFYLIIAAGSLYLLYRSYYSKKGEQLHEE